VRLSVIMKMSSNPPSTPPSSSIPSLDDAELDLLSLTNCFHSTISSLSSLSPSSSSSLSSQVAEFFRLLSRLNETLRFHLTNAPSERNYKNQVYLDMEKIQTTEENKEFIKQLVEREKTIKEEQS
jgi:hypothetical protein